MTALAHAAQPLPGTRCSPKGGVLPSLTHRTGDRPPRSLSGNQPSSSNALCSHQRTPRGAQAEVIPTTAGGLVCPLLPLSLLAPRRGWKPPACPAQRPAQPGGGASGSLQRLSPLRGTGGSKARSGPDREPPPQARSAALSPAPLIAARPRRFRLARPPHRASATVIHFRLFTAGHAGYCSPQSQA